MAPLIERRAYVRTFLNERQHLPTDSRRRIGRLSRAYERLIEDVLKSGARSGEFRRDLDCRLAALALLGIINSVAAWYGKEPNAALDRVAIEYVRLYLNGVSDRSRGGGKRPRSGGRHPRVVQRGG